MRENLQDEDSSKYFLEDYALFFWWKFSREKFLPKEEHFWISEVLSEKYSFQQSRFLKYLLSYSGTEKRFNMGIYSHFNIEENIPQTNEELLKYPLKTQKRIKEIQRQLKAFSYFEPQDLIFLEEVIKKSIGEYVYFLPKKWAKQLDDTLKEKLDSYITTFLQWELLVDDKNYFNFEKQKELLIQEVRTMKAFENFGQNFIISSNFHSVFDSEEKRQMLFLHTLYALELLGFIDVLKIWFNGITNEIVFHANILPHESFKELVYSDYRKENPKTLVLWFDNKTDTLTFWKKKIQFSKGKKETDSVLLVRSLMKAENSEYLHEDEILTEWGYQEWEEQKKLPKNKVYSACQKVQNTMKMEAGIGDFLEFNTSKVRINPQYMEVDK